MIGVFDSGVGGLSVWKELYTLLPGEKYLYLSDAGYCPYGPKSREVIIERARAITDYLIAEGAEIVVVACNTATAAAIEYLRKNYDIPFVGMEPAVKPAAINTRSGAIGVLATRGTFKGELYLRTLHKFASNAKVLEQVGEGLVELVENGETDTSKAKELIGRYVKPMLDENVDHIVLGCTHYPFLENAIREFAGPDVEIVNPAPAIARRVSDLLSRIRRGKPVSIDANTFVTTGENMDVMVDIVKKIAPDNYSSFAFEKIDLLPLCR